MRCLMERGLKSQEKTMTQPALPLVQRAVLEHCFPIQWWRHLMLHDVPVPWESCPLGSQYSPRNWLTSKLWEIWGASLDLTNLTESDRSELTLLQRFLQCPKDKRNRAWGGSSVRSLWGAGGSSARLGSTLVSWPWFSPSRNHLRGPRLGVLTVTA